MHLVGLPLWLVSALLLTACGSNGVVAERSTPTSIPEISRRSGALTPEVEQVLADIKAADSSQLSVSPEDGRFLRMLVAAKGARAVLEIGAASGYSGIWLGLGARQSGGTVVALEYDAERARQAADNIRRAGLSDVVTVVSGDAFVEIPKLSRSFDFVFLDAWKPDYLRFFDMVWPRLDKGGLFVAHNVVNKQSEMGDFLNTIVGHPQLFTTIVAPSAEGMSVSYRTY
jgi:predicted O-methyltransferase YrrM